MKIEFIFAIALIGFAIGCLVISRMVIAENKELRAENAILLNANKSNDQAIAKTLENCDNRVAEIIKQLREERDAHNLTKTIINEANTRKTTLTETKIYECKIGATNDPILRRLNNER